MIICGLDECGRGALAGPLVAAAVIIHKRLTVPLRDSKKLTSHQREIIVNQLNPDLITTKIEVISVELINQLGIGWANKEIFHSLINQIDADHYIVDGNLKLTSVKSYESKIKADDSVPEVMLASIIAKVYRDDLMRQFHNHFPIYDWAANKGYGTVKHLHAILQYGPSLYHRPKFLRKCVNSITSSQYL